MSTRKIKISQLANGMFIHELDIPWMKSPFLRHRRKIKSANDIALLKQAGVKELHIDLSRGADIPSNHEKPLNEHTSKNISFDSKEPPAVDEVSPSSSSEPLIDKQTSQNEAAQAVPLSEELKVAKILQGKICQLAKNGRPISAASISPIIQESMASITRNDQALLTLLHLHRNDIKLGDHAFGVFSLILPLAIKLNCSKEEINELGMAALLHDIGWARLPMHLLDKKKPYSSSEKQLTRQHISIAENVLKKCNELPDTVKTLIVQHHEFNDGSGYPKKLTKEKIHKLTQILQVTDAYDESIHGLMGQQGMLPATALKKLYRSAKKGLYSETIVGEMIHVIGIFPLTSAVELSSGEKALVVEIDKQKPLLPKVKIIYEADGQPCSSIKIIDLAAQNEDDDLKIIRVIDPIDRKCDPLGLLIVDSIESA
ncbi:MAG: DUF3391 domain-containing protein [Thiohalomonas sp.]|nr:DUF3391 domain-containing protein [Thiohalomonas sp.]